MFYTCVWVAAGAMFGATTRYLIGELAHRLWGKSFPWGTFTVNMLGCFLMGLCFAWFEQTSWFGLRSKAFVMIGLLGSLTTFSSFALDNTLLYQKQQLLAFAGNLIVHNALGIGLIVFGMWCGRCLEIK